MKKIVDLGIFILVCLYGVALLGAIFSEYNLDFMKTPYLMYNKFVGILLLASLGVMILYLLKRKVIVNFTGILSIIFFTSHVILMLFEIIRGKDF